MNSNHPGHEVDCILKVSISANRTDGQRGGYGCCATGGHCLPSQPKCNIFRAEHARIEQQQFGDAR